ncbi:MAG: hypothetical protein AMXMBFR57_01490 [Acidimicrobiia bacterium]
MRKLLKFTLIGIAVFIVAIVALASLIPEEYAERARAEREAREAAAAEELKQRRQPNEVRAEDYGDRWPLTIDSAILSCQVNGGRPLATIKTLEGAEHALNGAAKSTNRFRPVEPIWKFAQTKTPDAVADNVPEATRKTLFAAMVGCEDDADRRAEAETSDIRKQVDRSRALADQCKAQLRRANKLSEADQELISAEGVLQAWPPLQRTRVNIGPLLDAALALCKADERD